MHTRLVVISDLHLGGAEPRMMSRPDALARFIRSLSDASEPAERLELVLAGDIIDFLALPGANGASPTAWTLDPREAEAKLREVMDGPDAPIFAALRRHLERGHRLTLLLGNHDMELALPSVRDAVLGALNADRHRVLWQTSGEAYRVGGALIEHGNRYDDANLNDHDGLRRVVSAASRAEWGLVEQYGEALTVSKGSVLVEHCLNAYKEDYPFLDLLQPQGEGLLYLLAAFEPEARRALVQLPRLWLAQLASQSNKTGRPPKAAASVGASFKRARLPEFQARFGEMQRDMRDTAAQVAGGSVLRELLRPNNQGLRHLIDNDQPIPPDRLSGVRVAMAEMLHVGDLLSPSGPPGAYGLAADRLRASTGAELVVMGHTHMARQDPHPGNKAQYINTGTWADLIQVPPEVLGAEVDGERLRLLEGDAWRPRLEDYLRRLLRDEGVRHQSYTYADIKLSEGGEVAAATLEEWRDDA